MGVLRDFFDDVVTRGEGNGKKRREGGIEWERGMDGRGAVDHEGEWEVVGELRRRRRRMKMLYYRQRFQ